jgi:extracellular elastinolytic metalloproteinase
MSRSKGKRLLALVASVLMLALVSPVVGAGATSQSAQDPEDVAISFIQDNTQDYGVSSADVSDLRVISSYESSHTRVTHVNLNQRREGLEVFGGYATVNLLADGSVLFVGETLVDGLNDASGSAQTDAVGAVEAAADGLDLDDPRDVKVIDQGTGPAKRTIVSGGNISDEPIPVRLGWQPTASGLRLAWQLIIDDTSEEHLWNATVDAETGELLDVDDWTDHDTVEGIASGTARSVATPKASSALAAGPLPPEQVDDGSSYRVFELPKESPNDGPRTLVNNPADALASPFGWHDTDGADGPEFTITRGNNTHSYLDQDNNNTADFGDTDGGPSLTFDFPADLNEHAQNYRDAVVSNLFYWNNVFHDVMYQYGFDEVSGNFQANNYGRGGGEGDYVRSEAADGGGTNNANFSTPAADAGMPRMQMYLWPGNQFGSQNQAVVDGVGSFGASWSRFGPAPTPVGTSGELALVNDGSAAPTEGCGALIDFPAGAIAVVDRGTCTFLSKVENAQAAGASAVILANNTTGNAPS